MPSVDGIGAEAPRLAYWSLQSSLASDASQRAYKVAQRTIHQNNSDGGSAYISPSNVAMSLRFGAMAGSPRSFRLATA